MLAVNNGIIGRYEIGACVLGLVPRLLGIIGEREVLEVVGIIYAVIFS